MRMIHATPAKNAAAILTHGILAAKSKGAIATVWLTTEGRWAWALKHVRDRHKTDEIVIFTVNVPKSWLKRGGRSGMKHTGKRDIPADRIKLITDHTIEIREPEA